MQNLLENNLNNKNLNDINYWALRKNEIRKQVLQDYQKNPINFNNKISIEYQQNKLDNQNSFKTFGEGLSDSFKIENTPFLGSWIEGNKFKKLNEITAKIYNQGFDSLDYNEQVEFEKYRNELIKQNVYGDSFAYKLGGIALNNAKYVIEYATTQAIANAVLPGSGILLSSAIQSLNPVALRNEYWARQLAGDLNITEKGEMFFGNLEKDPIKTFLKSYTGLLATNLSEKFGDVLASSTPIKAISNKLTGGYKKIFDLLFVGNGTDNKGIKGGLQSLFNGLVGENVEEYLEQPLRELLGGGEEDYTLENIVKAFDITWDDFLLTNASIVMQSGISNTSLLLANKLKSNKNLSQQDIINYLETQPVEQKEKDLKRLQIAENEAEKQEYEDWQKTQKEVLLKAGATEQEANDQLEIINKFISHGAVNFLDTPTSRINFLKQNNFELQNGVNSLDGDNVFNQSLDIAKQNEELDAKFPEYTGNTISINGIEKSVFNNNGERIAKSKEALENFYKWFGDSKAVNEKGEPLVVYHGTDKSFDTFKGKFFFFTDDKKLAEDYSQSEYNKRYENEKVINAYLNLKNPLIIDAKGHFWNTIDYKNKQVDGEKLSSIAKKQNKDGLILLNVKDPAKPWSFTKNTTDYVVFEPNQIKSVENKGQFSLDNDNIYYQNKNNQPLGQYNTSNGIATLFNSSNFSTPIHEFAHYWRQLVNNFARAGSEQAKKELDILNKYVGAKNNESWTRSQEEKFARSFEAYLTKGIAPTEELKPLFQRIKEAMANVYNSIKNLNVSLTPEITKYFDNIFSDVDIEGKINYQQAYQDLQKEIEDEKKILYQQGLSEDEVNKAIDDKFGERLAKIEAEIDKGREKTNEAFSEKNYKLNAELQRIKKDINNNSWVKDGLKNFFITTGNLLKEIGGEKLFYKLRKLEADTNLWTKQDSNILEPFLTKFADIENKNKDDYSTLDLALKNSDIKTIEKIIQKYNMYDDYIAYRNLLDTMREQLINVGVDVGYIENYSPRKVDPNLLEDYLNFLRDNKKETSNILDLELSKLEKEGKIFSEEDRQKYINQILNGEYKSIIGRASNNATKERQIEALTPQQNQFYLSSIETISQMVQQNRKAILQREFFGKENKEIGDLRRKLKAKNKQLKELEDKNASNIKKNEIIKLETRKKVLEVSLEGLEYSLKKENDNIKKEEIQNKINNLNKIKDGIERNLKFYKTIKAEAVKTLRRKEIQEAISDIENKIPEDTPLKESIGSYVDEIEGLSLENKFKLKEILNAVLNPLATNKWSSFLSNSSFGLALNSIKNAVNQLPELAISFYKNGILRTANTLTSPKKITIEDLGLGDLVFDISKKDSKFFKFLSKYTLLDKFDAFSKNTFINAKLKLTQDLLKQNDNLTNKELDLIFGEQAEKVKENILKGNVNNIDVKSYLLIKLGEVQPLFNSDKTLAYLKYPNTRFVYSLKSFAFKQFNLIKNDIIDKITSGNKKEVIEGLRNLVLYQTYIMLIGGGLDLAMNLMGDDDPEKAITDAMLDNIIFMNIINRYMYTKIAKEGGGKAIVDYLFGVPILGLFDGITKDIQKAYQGNLDFDNSKTLKFVPFAKDIKFLKQTYENLN